MKCSFTRKRFLPQCRRRNKTLLLFILSLLLFSITGHSQNTTILKGRITDESAQPVQRASIIVKGFTTGASSDDNGNFEISALPNSTLIVSSVGFTPREVRVSGNQFLNVSLQRSATDLGEVVVVGYGTQKKIAVTGAVSTVKGSELAESPVSNISNSIAGKLAGVSMRPNGGQLGADAPDIHIRGIGTTGNNAPLIVVDGIIRNNINQIDPNSIETVTVLKDAAAVAPYGLGGANGVILITTKRGKTGAPSLSLNTYYGVQKPTYNFYSKLLDAKDYMSLRNEAYLNDNLGVIPPGGQLTYDPALITDYNNLHAKDPDKYPDSNPGEYAKLSVPMQQYDLQLSGGTEKIKYYAGLGYFEQSGMFKPMNYKRYNYSINMEVKATNTTKVSFTLLGSIENNNSVDPEENASGLFRSGYKFIPTQAIHYSNGLWGEFAGRSPVGILNSGGYLHNSNNTLLSTISIEQQLPFIRGLSAKATFSYDPNQQTIKGWHRPYYFYSQNTNTTPYTYEKQISTNEGGAHAFTSLNQQYFKNQIFTFQGFLNYHNTFGKHDITGLLVAEARNNKNEFFSAQRNNFAIDIDELGMGSSNRANFNNNGSSSTGSQIGYVYRLGYGYNNKYLFEASGRYDGHYYFAPGKRWGYFPAFSAGWVLSKESFFKVPFVDNLKIRGSWGKSGNLAGTAFQYLNGYTLYGNSYAFGTGTMVQGSYVPREANPNITWEIATKSDVGFEASLWGGLLNIEADYFAERREGMLLPPIVSVPVEYGLALSDENAGTMSGHGMEISIGSSYHLKKNLILGISGNFSYAKNKMINIFETSATHDSPNRSRTGRAFGTPFGYHTLGLFTTADDKNGDGIINSADGYNIIQFGDLHPGDIRYADISGPDGGKPDGKIDASDETVIGYPVYPAISYGFTPTASWKGFDISLFFQGSALVSLDLNATFQTLPFANNSSNTTTEYLNNRWTPAAQDAKYPRATQAPYANNTQTSDYWMMGTGFIRLKTAVVGYTIPTHVMQSLKIQSVRFYVSGQNLLTMSKLKFMDPEVGYSNKETAYPNQMVYTFGLNVTF